MGVFQYEARNRAGEFFAGTVEARDEREAAGLIRRRGLWVAALHLQCEEAAGAPAVSRWRQQLAGALAKTPPAKLRVLFLRQMAAMMQAGMPVHQALQALAKSDADRAYQSLLQQLLAGILAGRPLHERMAMHPAVFPVSLCGLVRAGEESGSLTQIFAQLADFEEHRYEAREALKSALLYPVILLVVSLVALVLMAVFVLPAFAVMLQDLQAELPWTTRFLLALMDFVSGHLAALLIGSALVVLASIALVRDMRTRTVLDGWLLKMPILGPLQRASAWRILLELFAVMLKNGIPLTTALAMAADVPANRHIACEMKALRTQVESGQPFAASLRQLTSCPRLLVELLMAGEVTGQFRMRVLAGHDAMMEKAAAFAAADARHRSARVEALAEPVMIFVVGGMIFFFVLSIVLPLLTTMDALV